MIREECVHCTTKEEYDFVCKCFNLSFSNSVDEYINKGEICIYWKTGTYSDLDYAIEYHTVISFNEWCKLTNNYLNNKQIENKGMIKEMLDILEKTYTNPILRRTTVPLFMSSPGQGKSTVIKQFAESKGVNMVKITLSQRMPNEVVGMLMPDLKTGKMVAFNSYELSKVKPGDIVFFDEVFNGTLKQSLDATLNFFEDRKFPNGERCDDIMIIAASNPQGLINLTPQIKERFIRYDLKFSAPEYQAYLKNKYGMPESISTHLCTLINKEKFEMAMWDYVTPRSIEKAINQIGCDIPSPYQDILLPFLNAEINSPIDIALLGVKAGDKVPYLNLLKLIIKNNNDVETSKLKSKEVSLVS